MNPILTPPYEEPQFHYAMRNGELNYDEVKQGRRQSSEAQFINLIREEVKAWREQGYPYTTRVSQELLYFWFKNPDRADCHKLFYAQQEAIETSIWLNELTQKSNVGQSVLNQLKAAQQVSKKFTTHNLPRIAFKMATGTGKTVVMAAQIVYHLFNRQEYPMDTRFADNFLIITPSITIKNRLSVLFVDTLNRGNNIEDYYHIRQLIPLTLMPYMSQLNARLIITNYHALEPKILQGNKRSPFDGKKDATGKKQEAKEEFNQVIKRLLGKFKKNSRLLIINDEAHHCFWPKEKGKANDEENSKAENAHAAIWFNGLVQITQKFKVSSIYDLSATPYYLSHSGYPAHQLFPWVVSDFGLIEAIESGLVKIPFLPEFNQSETLSQTVLKNLYDHVKDELPKKGDILKNTGEQPPNLPVLLKTTLTQFYSHYEKDFNRIKTLFGNPPVFIIVCNNTWVSKEVYKYIAGYELTDEAGQIVDTVIGQYELFSNFDPLTKHPLPKPPTLLIDSNILDNTELLNTDFKKVFAPELENFKRAYRNRHPEKSEDNITDADILREVVNTVGKPGTLGAHIRCVVSVSMLTEGWDANSVTHIMGLRAFNSQLLCEQVAGRALRRQRYHLDQSGKLPPEYAQIIGVPFKLFKGGKTSLAEPVENTRIYALQERKTNFEIRFPQLVGYRIESLPDEIRADFSGLENFEIDTNAFSMESERINTFSPEKERLNAVALKEKRDQTLIYEITKALIHFYYSDEDGNPKFYHFNTLKQSVETWYFEKVTAFDLSEPDYRKWLYFETPQKICAHIIRGMTTQHRDSNKILPVFHPDKAFGSTQEVNGTTSKSVYLTRKSHVNGVVANNGADITAKILDFLDDIVISYVNNSFLGFTIPYVEAGKDQLYYPDFIAKCKKNNGETFHLIIALSNMKQDNLAKKWTVQNCWLPAVNSVRKKYGYEKWEFIEISNENRKIENELNDKIGKLL
jgi:type III restriction enzyme